MTTTAASATTEKTVLWLPCHPSMGGGSMDRHWRELDEQRRLNPSDALRFRCPLQLPPDALPAAGRLNRAWNKYVAYPALTALSARSADAVHLLDHSHAHLLGYLPERVFKISTVHDLIPLRDSSGLSPAQSERFKHAMQKLTLSDLILADSEFTARDVVHFLGYPREKVRVLFLGVNLRGFDVPRQLPAAISEKLAGRRTILHVSAGNARRKNLEALPDILRALRAEAGSVMLVRVGPPMAAALAQAVREALGAGGALLELGRLPEEHLIALYQAADALIFPSLLEGFGFPLLEAMAAGCPVVSSDASSLPEVGGDAALYFDPAEPAAAARELTSLLVDENFRQRRIAAGRARAATFTWTRHWQELTRIYAQALA